MNERIKALYKEATGKTFANDFDARVIEAERFAELIVRECANLPFKDTGEVTTIGEIAVSNRILRHFGLEQ